MVNLSKGEGNGKERVFKWFKNGFHAKDAKSAKTNYEFQIADYDKKDGVVEPGNNKK